MCWVYIVRCSDGTLYTGWSTDPETRAKCHNSGHGAKYTKSRLPVELVYSEQLENKSLALKREWEIKRMSRAKKLCLIEKALIQQHGEGGQDEKAHA